MSPVAQNVLTVVSSASACRIVSRQQTSTSITGIQQAEDGKNAGTPSNQRLERELILRTVAFLFAGIVPSFIFWDLFYLFTGDDVGGLFFTFLFALGWAYTISGVFRDAMDKIAEDIQK